MKHVACATDQEQEKLQTKFYFHFSIAPDWFTGDLNHLHTTQMKVHSVSVTSTWLVLLVSNI